MPLARPRTLVEAATDFTNPAEAIVAGLGCALFFPACLAQDLSATAGDVRESARQTTTAIVSAAESTGAGLTEGALAALRESTGPLEQAASIAQAGAFALYAILGIIVVLIFWWTFLK